MENEHVDKAYEAQLSQLKNTILLMGSLVEEMLGKSHRALSAAQSDLAQEIVNQDHQVDMLEIDIHRRCTDILALRQPAGSDLRFIILGLRIATDLERIGDSAKTIGRRIIDLNRLPRIKEYVDLPKMLEVTVEMVKGSLDAFVKRDDAQARQICIRDDVVDDFRTKIIEELIEFMEKNPDKVEPATLLIDITHKIERIADHATNIAEEVIYLVSGQDIRHNSKKLA